MKKWPILAVIMLVLILVSCSNGDKTTDEPTSETETNEQPTSSTTYPFTGLQATEGADNRAFAVMVNNHREARPQSGLSKADIVFELLAEGDITRFLAIYQSEKPDIVGPVRSAREYYFTLANSYDAVYVYHGAANFVEEMIQSRGIEHISGAKHDNDRYLFYRESFRKEPHNSYFHFQHAIEAIDEKGYDTTFDYEPFLFSTEIDDSGEEARQATIKYGSSGANVHFTYDETIDAYHRYDNDQQTVELSSEVPIAVNNVFIVETEHRVIDNEGRRFIDLDSGGKAYLLQGGYVQTLEWENRDGRIIPVKDGEVVPFVPGKTWINFIPLDGAPDQVQFSNET